jgi:hypothetical protein
LRGHPNRPRTRSLTRRNPIFEHYDARNPQGSDGRSEPIRTSDDPIGDISPWGAGQGWVSQHNGEHKDVDVLTIEEADALAAQLTAAAAELRR